MGFVVTRPVRVVSGWLLMGLIFLPGCRSLEPLPAVDLKQPGWSVREGEAVWRPKRDAPEIAGEVLLAKTPQGQSFVQFTKNPFPMVIAQSTSNGWQLELPMQKKRYSGSGKPPRRLLWLQLPELLFGRTAEGGWSYERLDHDRWRVANAKTGESLEGIFNP